MKKSSKIFLALMAVVCLAFVGCPSTTAPDTWTEVSTFDGLDGTWKTTMTVKKQGIEAEATMIVTIKGEKADMITSVKMDMTAIIDAQASGDKELADEVWQVMKSQENTEEYDGVEVSFSEGRPYIMTQTTTIPNCSFDELADGATIYVNGNKTKLKMVDEVETGDVSVSGTTILTKQ